MRKRLKNAVVAMASCVRGSLPHDVPNQDIGVLLAAHGTPYVPPFPEFGWEEGQIHSYLPLTEDLFYEGIGRDLPWTYRTGRMNYAAPSLEDSLAAFEADGISHFMVVPSAFPTAAMHTIWDVAEAVAEAAVLPQERVVVHTRTSGMKVYYSARGFADLEPGRAEFRGGLSFIAKAGVMEALDELEIGEPPAPCLPGEICVTITTAPSSGSNLRFMLYETSGGFPKRRLFMRLERLWAIAPLS